MLISQAHGGTASGGAAAKADKSERVLSLRGCDVLDTATITALIGGTRGRAGESASLGMLDVRQCGLHTTTLVDALVGCLGTGLRVLDVSGNALGAEGCRALNAWLRGGSCRLRELRASSCGLDAKSASILLQATVPGANTL